MIGRTEHTIRVNLHRELLIKLWTDGLDFKRKFQNMKRQTAMEQNLMNYSSGYLIYKKCEYYLRA